jgi:hypothetical protein
VASSFELDAPGCAGIGLADNHKLVALGINSMIGMFLYLSEGEIHGNDERI